MDQPLNTVTNVICFIPVLPFQESFQSITWNYFESSLGKGAADAFGGVLKRTADRTVDSGTDITGAHICLIFFAKRLPLNCSK